MEPKVVTLSQPVEWGTEKITAIKFPRPPVGRDYRDLPIDESKHNVGHMMDLAARIANIDVAILEKLALEDLAKVLGVLGELRQAGQGIGAPASAS